LSAGSKGPPDAPSRGIAVLALDRAARAREPAAVARTPTGTTFFWPMVPRMAPPADYDFHNAELYLRLLLAEASGASEFEIARDVFLNVKTPCIRLASLAARSHLERAHWLFENRFLPLIWAIDD
jgi:hypothetical protein